MKIIFIGDIMGKIGRETIKKILPEIKSEYKPDLIIANAENCAHGSGITDQTAKELVSYGIDYMTLGDHAFSRPGSISVFDDHPVIRPANYAANVPGAGYTFIPVNKGKNNESFVLLVNLIGRVFMKMDYNCPFQEIDAILANDSLPQKNISAIIVDIHAETTSEKINMGYHLDGRVSAVLGTHTHVETADERILNKGTAYITDVGMTGAANESLGILKKGTLETLLTQIKQPHVIPEKGEAMLSAVMVDIDQKTTLAKSIKRIKKFIKIN